jgi:hypothetical protein
MKCTDLFYKADSFSSSFFVSLHGLLAVQVLAFFVYLMINSSCAASVLLLSIFGKGRAVIYLIMILAAQLTFHILAVNLYRVG